MPPCTATDKTSASRRCTPVPHDTEQAPHLCHECTQSTGQACTLQSRCSLSAAHGAPPKSAARVTTRWRSCKPPPHASEQLPQGLNKETTQSTGAGVGGGVGAIVGCGQRAVAHNRSCAEGHALPPCAAPDTTRAPRRCTPLPQEREHLPQDCHWWTQSTGHALVLQVWASLNVGHAAPPAAMARSTTR